MKFRIKERVNNAGYKWFYVQQHKGLWWGLPSSDDLQQIWFGHSGARMTYKEFKNLEDAQSAIEKARQNKSYIKTVYEE